MFDRVPISSTLFPLQVLNQIVSHSALTLAVLPQQLPNCGENIGVTKCPPCLQTPRQIAKHNLDHEFNSYRAKD